MIKSLVQARTVDADRVCGQSLSLVKHATSDIPLIAKDGTCTSDSDVDCRKVVDEDDVKAPYVFNAANALGHIAVQGGGSVIALQSFHLFCQTLFRRTSCPSRQPKIWRGHHLSWAVRGLCTASLPHRPSVRGSSGCSPLRRIQWRGNVLKKKKWWKAGPQRTASET